ncbi:MAG: radical SAM-associated putative lipoprotein [Candidatus Sabulitectum sp.]|nr:radical SAM-associated putative lipoprotein [Candidatus Sabulitectum sp.]
MAEAVRSGRIVFLRLISKLFASALSLAGILSCCDSVAEPTYGPPATLYFSGQTSSAADSSSIAGIQIQIASPDSSIDYSTSLSDENGQYQQFIENEFYPWPDTVRVIATDIDGDQNGLFAAKDTLLFPERDQEFQEFQINFYLEKE